MASKKEESRYGEPMPWIGTYVAVASAACLVAVAADVIRSFRGSKFWIPSKFFAFNAAMLTILAIATKIPSDVNDDMPGIIDQFCKMSGILLICIAMSHAMPSLGVMDGYVLFSNMIALGILVISTAVNIWFQIRTELVGGRSCYYFPPPPPPPPPHHHHYYNTSYSYSYSHLYYYYQYRFGDITYTAVMVFMYAILVSHAMSVSTVKLLLEKQFDSKHKEIIGQVNPHNSDGSYNIAVTISIERLKEYVKKYWLMVLTSSPDYVLRTSGVSFVCSLSCCLLLAYLVLALSSDLVVDPFGVRKRNYICSDYKWSTGAILIVQILASAVGAVSSLLRMFQSRVGRDECGNFRSLLFIEQYRVQQHESWKKKPLPFHMRNKRARSIAYNAKAAAVALLILFERMVVFLTRLLHLIFFCIGAVFSWPLSLFRSFIGRFTEISSVLMSDEEDLSGYVLTLEEESDPNEVARKWKDYPYRWLEEGQAGRPRNLYVLMTKLIPSSLFVGLQSSTASLNDTEGLGDCWSLSIVTLACIMYAAYHGTSEGESLELLMETLDEGFPYIIFVDENHANASKEALETAKMVWQKLRIRGEWLDMPLRRLSQRKIIVDTIKYLELNGRIRALKDEEMDPRNCSRDVIMAAKSMVIAYVLDCKILPFKSLEAEVVVVLRGCLENMPMAILNECSRGSYGSREEHIRLAARMLGEMEEILKLLEEGRMDP